MRTSRLYTRGVEFPQRGHPFAAWVELARISSPSGVTASCSICREGIAGNTRFTNLPSDSRGFSKNDVFIAFSVSSSSCSGFKIITSWGEPR